MKLLILIIYLNLIQDGFYLAQAQKNNSPRMIGGYEVTNIRDYPYTAVLIEQWGHMTTFLCSCVKVTRLAVLTTASCITPKLMGALDEGTLMVRGNTLNWEIYEGDDHYVIKINKHKGYNSTSNDFDVAVLKVIGPFEMNSWLKLPPSPMHKNDINVTVLGWGTKEMEVGGTFMADLFVVSIPIMEWGVCKKKISDKLTNNMFCGNALIEGPCTHDKGGPVVLSRGEKKYLVGLVSFSYLTVCGVATDVSIFTNLWSMRKWIWKQIKGTEDDDNVDGNDDDAEDYREEDDDNKVKNQTGKKRSKYVY